MASIIPGYNYDIFISYRQKDNRGGRQGAPFIGATQFREAGWVSEFVEALTTELESTFKEEISVYFDVNPHDGLLETHDVDASLKEKLKCLIFIPIISRTYCDPKSFAWEHEFRAFVDIASHDQFGLKIKLPGGNVANRILPVQIHDLNAEDKKLFEGELGGYIRGIEFIYKEPGVNRPLMASEDHPDNNLNRTFYRNQINKVANAINEIIDGLKKSDHPGKIMPGKIIKEKPLKKINQITKIIAGVLTVLALLVAGYLIVPKLAKPGELLEKSIAVLPFKNDSPDAENQHIIDGTMEAILDNLCKIENLKVLSRTSIEQYRSTPKSVPEIAKDLKVGYILEGSGQKYGDEIRLTVQLIDAVNDKHVWSSSYDRNIKDIFKIQSEIAQTIASEIKVIITPEEKALIEKIPTNNMTAYDLYLKAIDFLKNYSSTRDLSSYQTAVNLFKTSIEVDTSFAKAYTGLAQLYWYRYYSETYFKDNFLDSCLVLANIALSLDDKLEEGYLIKGYYLRENGQIDEALDNYEKAIEINPNYFLAYSARGYTLYALKLDYLQGIENYHKALSLIRGKESLSLLRGLGNSYVDIGFTEKAKYYFNEALKLDGDSGSYFSSMASLEYSIGNFKEALKLGTKSIVFLSAPIISPYYYIGLPDLSEEAYAYAKRYDDRIKKTGRLNLFNSHNVGYLCWQAGKYKEAEDYFYQQIKYSEESIKLEKPESQSRKTHQSCLAQTYAFIGDKNKCYQYLDELNAVKVHPRFRITLFKNTPFFQGIRNEDRFMRIIQNMEVNFQAEHEKVGKWLEKNNML